MINIRLVIVLLFLGINARQNCIYDCYKLLVAYDNLFLTFELFLVECTSACLRMDGLGL